MNNLKRLIAALSIDGVAVLIAFLIMCVYFTVVSPFFLTPDNIHNTLVESLFIVMLAAGMTYVIISGGFDLSVGSNIGLSAAVALFTSMNGAPVVIAALAGIGTGLAFGVVNGYFIARVGLSDFIVTLATLSLGAGLLQVFTASTQLTGTSDPAFPLLTDASIFGIPMGVVITAAALLLLELVLVKTPFGRSIYAAGVNSNAAYLAGVGVRSIKFYVFVISGVVGGLAGVLLASHLNSVQPGLGSGYELQAIAACVVGGVALSGGRGSIWRAAVGAFFLSVLSRGLQLIGVDPLWFSIVTGAAIVAAVAFDRGAQRLLQSRFTRPASTPSGSPVPTRSEV
ncbi:ribose/xylose/arabinose/galactoside ABC-type transport system permease subunit [Arthrobacter pigmenti]|uniref:Ribose/xylose/arabinose/galactoside ABC-type transport system permease subunit n=1 Tax=Arthrobacter pigmenti TaxID=271432 RepID=A0A846RP08_9MICC|nr:ABC transporter permease [Arthrobacter pigmenti]NJC21515.1 ribose/xylose/arabinose/galactoside ABC-type transport system permease subunit [Arthrobacter pigmenti]